MGSVGKPSEGWQAICTYWGVLVFHNCMSKRLICRRPGYRSTAEHILTLCKDREYAVPFLAGQYAKSLIDQQLTRLDSQASMVSARPDMPSCAPTCDKDEAAASFSCSVLAVSNFCEATTQSQTQGAWGHHYILMSWIGA